MTVAQSIVQKSEMILRICQWLDDDVKEGGYSIPIAWDNSICG